MLEDTFDVMHNLVETPLGMSYDVYAHKESSSLNYDNILSNPLGHSDVDPMCSQRSSSLKYYFDEPIDDPMICDSNVDLDYESNTFDVLGGNVDNFLSLRHFSGYDDALGPYCIYLVDKAKQIMLNTFLDLSFDFSMAFTLLKIALTFLAMIILVLSYCHACEAHSVELTSFYMH